LSYALNTLVNAQEALEMAVCSVCGHEEARKINAALISGQLVVRVAKRFNVSRQALGRHRAKHLQYRAPKTPPATTLEGKFHELSLDMANLQAEALCGVNVRDALAVMRMRMTLLELEAKVTGRLNDGKGGVNVTVNAGASAPAASQDDAEQIIAEYIALHGIPPHLLPQAQETPIEIPAPGDADGKPTQDTTRSQHGETLDVAGGIQSARVEGN
jgi:hypothetical protein